MDSYFIINFNGGYMKKIIYVLIVICSIQNSNLQAAQYENDYNFLKNIKV